MLELEELFNLTGQVFNQVKLEVLLEEYILLNSLFALFVCGCHLRFI
jgi:hypothetical protein